MNGWTDGWVCVGGGARHRRALICPLPLISLLVLIWIATCEREWIHSYKRSTTGCSSEWQPPYVPGLLCGGYINKPLWQIKTTGIKVHDIITCSSRKLPFPLPTPFFILAVYSLPSSFSECFTLKRRHFHHANLPQILLHPRGRFHVPPVHVFISSLPSVTAFHRCC